MFRSTAFKMSLVDALSLGTLVMDASDASASTAMATRFFFARARRAFSARASTAGGGIGGGVARVFAPSSSSSSFFAFSSSDLVARRRPGASRDPRSTPALYVAPRSSRASLLATQPMAEDAGRAGVGAEVRERSARDRTVLRRGNGTSLASSVASVVIRSLVRGAAGASSSTPPQGGSSRASSRETNAVRVDAPRRPRRRGPRPTTANLDASEHSLNY
eukprot:31309-Pelagococcus_subviridis.AAC.1